MKKLVKILKGVKDIYRNALENSRIKDKKELILSLAKKHASKPKTKAIAAQLLLIEDTDVDVMREGNKLLAHEYFPESAFEIDMFYYAVVDMLIAYEFKKAIKLVEEKVDKFIVNRLRKLLRNTFVDNPNFQGTNPYYKRNYVDYLYAKKRWIETLDGEFDGYIGYFSELES